MIRFDAISLRYPRREAPVVDDVTFDVVRGSVTAVVGPNGSGKSTLVRALLGRITPVAGRILIDGAPLASLGRREVARRLSVVVQREEPLYPLTVREYVALGRYAHESAWRPAGDASHRVVDTALAQVDATAFAARHTDELSGGEWQRVRLARALAQGGDALVLDEPGTFLDVAHEMSQFELLAGLARAGRAVLLVSHHLNLVARFASTMVLLDQGRIAAIGSPTDVMRGDVLERVYRWPVVVTRDPAVGAPSLVPLRAPAHTPLAHPTSTDRRTSS
jgi:iron complex transport system ATP-binding protein